MTFRTFARKFKKKANEWINNNQQLEMWEHESIRKHKSLDLLGLEDFSLLESFSENELLELLKSLENDEMIQEIESQLLESNGTVIDSLLNTNEGIDVIGNSTDVDSDQTQTQDQTQSVRAEIHTHNHYYLIQRQDGTIQVRLILIQFGTHGV